MAIEIGPIKKPFIYLEGAEIDNLDIPSSNISNQTAFAARVDHAKEEAVTTLNTFSGVTVYNQSSILTFNNRVRIVITPKVGENAAYKTAMEPMSEHETIFEGSLNGVPDFADGSGNLLANKYAETWFTLNGKDPVRGKSYLYKYLDTRARATLNDDGLPNSWVGLGFLLDACSTGSDLITLKARTFYQGNKSRVAVAKFKIARSSLDNGHLSVGNATPPGR